MSVTTINSQQHVPTRQLPARQLPARSLEKWFRSWARFGKRERGANNIRIVCKSGVVWVTIENDARDYFVRACETRCFSSQSRIVAQGLGKAKFRVENCQVLTPRTQSKS